MSRKLKDYEISEKFLGEVKFQTEKFRTHVECVSSDGTYFHFRYNIDEVVLTWVMMQLLKNSMARAEALLKDLHNK